MPSANEIKRYVSEFVDGKMSIDEFEDWSARSSWNIHKQGEPEAQELAYLIRSVLNERVCDQSEASFREELAYAIRPFAPKWEIVSTNVFLLKKDRSAAQVVRESQAVASGKTEVWRADFVALRKPPMSAPSSATLSLVQVAEPA